MIRQQIARLRNPLLKMPIEVVDSPRGRNKAKVAFLASFGSANEFSRSIVETTRSLVEREYDVVLIRASNGVSRSSWPAAEESIRPTILYRSNNGYDFGSWAVGLHRFPELAMREHVLLLNDSIVGPFGPLDKLLGHFEKSTADVWGAAASLQFKPHLQSFMLGFRRGTLSKYPLNKFWNSVGDFGDKERVIAEYELGLPDLLDSELLTVDAFFRGGIMNDQALNPSLDQWERMLDRGFPFVKRQLLSNSYPPELQVRVLEVLQKRYAVDPASWVEHVETSGAS